MTTALMVLGAVVLVLLIVGVLCQCCTSSFMWVMHAVNGTVGLLLEAMVWCIAGAFQAVTGSNG